MASNGYHHSAHAQAQQPVECLNEHLNYFSENFSSGFDDIFHQDFDLVFDPLMMTANPVPIHGENHYSHSEPQYHHHEQTHQSVPQQTVQHVVSSDDEPLPYHVQSSYSHHEAAHTHHGYQSQQHHLAPMTVASSVQPVTPAVPSKPVFSKSTISQNAVAKMGPAIVSPTSVTSVFTELPPQAKKPTVHKAGKTVAKAAPRKRTISQVKVEEEEEEPGCQLTAEETANLSFQEQEDLRRERNRHHAKKSRQRKRDYMNQLEDAVNDMRKENERLFQLLGMDPTKAKYDLDQEHERKAAIATDKFVAALKQPRNRVLDNTTLAFLRELWK